MNCTLSILNGHGDTKLSWDPADPAQCAEIRKTVADLKALGHLFFLANGSPADEVSVGAGTLLVRRLDADEVAPDPVPPEPPTALESADATPAPKRRGRPPRNPVVPAQNVVAIRPLRGG